VNLVKSLKHKLDRRSLEIVYTSFIRPKLEYGCEIFSGSAACHLNKLFNLELNLLRTITGATVICSSTKVYREFNKVSLKSRMYYRTIQQLHKIHTKKAPTYLINILATYKNLGNYGFRFIHNYIQPLARTNNFASSFFPRAIRLWNILPDEIKEIENYNKFKTNLTRLNRSNIPKDRINNDMDSCNPNFRYFGIRWCNVHHARLRMNCSQLNSDLYYNLHVIANPSCLCGHLNETASHFFLECPLYRNERDVLLNGLPQNCIATISLLLYGSPLHTDAENSIICNLVHEFIKKSNRFR
jgi:hypothetical protein